MRKRAGKPLRHPSSPAFGSSSGSRRRNGTGWSRNGWTAQGQLNRSPPLLRRAGRHGQARCGSIPFTRRRAGTRRCRGLSRAMPLSPRAGGHAAGQKQGRCYSDRRSDRRRLRMGHSRPPGGAAKVVLSPSSLPPERPQPYSLRRVPESRGGCAPVVYIPRLRTGARINARVCRCSGFNLREVFPTGCIAGRAERAARSPGRGLRRWAELDRSRPQPVVDVIECLDQFVVPWILRIE